VILSLQKHKAILICLFLALFLRLGFFLWITPWNNVDKIVVVRSCDSAKYHDEAMNLLEKRMFSLDGVHSNTYHTPGYAAFVASIYALAGVRPWLVFIPQIVISVFICFLIFVLGKMIFSEKAGIIASSLVAIDPTMIYFTNQLYSECLAVFAVVTSLLFLVMALKKDKLIFIVFSALFSAVAMYIRTLTQFFPIFFILAILFVYRGKWITRAKYSVVFVLVLLALLSPWQLRNYRLTGCYTFSTSAEGWLPNVMVYFRVLNEGVSREEAGQDLERQVNEQLSLSGGNNNNSQFTQKRVAKEIAISYLKKNWKSFLVWNLRGTVRNFTTHGAQYTYETLLINNPDKQDLTISKTQSCTDSVKLNYFTRIQEYLRCGSWLVIFLFIGFTLLLLFEYFFWGFGTIRLLMDKKVGLTLLTLGIIFHIPFIAALDPMPRIRMLVTPVYCLIAGYGITVFWNKIKTMFAGIRSCRIRIGGQP